MKGDIPQLTLEGDYVNPQYPYDNEPSICNSPLWGFRKRRYRRRYSYDANQLSLHEIVIVDEFYRLKFQDVDKAIEFAYKHDQRLLNKIIEEYRPRAKEMLNEIVEKLKLPRIDCGYTSYLVVHTKEKTYYVNEENGQVRDSLASYGYCIVPKISRKLPVEDIIISKILALITGKYDPEKRRWVE